jgi:pyruvate dehydrogenase E2 component (dihydrolipoamide acetyltransferase)
MPSIKNIALPDIGDFDEVEIIEILVSIGDVINVDDGIITLESDKASMEIPSQYAGMVSQIHVNIGDKISKGTSIISIEIDEKDTEIIEKIKSPESKSTMPDSQITPIVVPDIGDFEQVEVIEVLVKTGDEIAKDQGIITLESDKASMEIPAPTSGKVSSININVGDKVGLGSLILSLETNVTGEPVSTEVIDDKPLVKESTNTNAGSSTSDDTSKTNLTSNVSASDSHASPSIRKLARELGVDLSIVKGKGRKGRVLDADLKSHVKAIIVSGGSGSSIPSTPVVDFSKFGEIEIKPLSRINKLSGKHLTASWLNIPHVTQFDEVNIDQMEAFRNQQKSRGVKLTPLVFIMKAVVQALKKQPIFNSSLDESGENLILKKYFNIGIAVDTPGGLVVPVIRDVDKKSLVELADELSETSSIAREGNLKPADFQGSCFSISSLGGIGGTQFTPIVNAPEVAILGVSRSQIKPVWDGDNFIPTLKLPLALSYDHRVIDGAQGARFMSNLNSILSDIREILL